MESETTGTEVQRAKRAFAQKIISVMTGVGSVAIITALQLTATQHELLLFIKIGCMVFNNYFYWTKKEDWFHSLHVPAILMVTAGVIIFCLEKGSLLGMIMQQVWFITVVIQMIVLCIGLLYARGRRE